MLASRHAPATATGAARIDLHGTLQEQAIQMLVASNSVVLHRVLRLHNLRSLALVSRAIFAQIKIVISQFTFHWTAGVNFKMYAPKRVLFNKIPLPSPLPSHISELVFHDNYPYPICLSDLSSCTNITHITFGSNFDGPINDLPRSLQSLSLSGNFSHSLDHLPPSLKRLSVAGKYDLPIDHLPSTLTTLSMQGSFGHPIDHLPPFLSSFTVEIVLTDHIDNFRAYATNAFVNPRRPAFNHLPCFLTHLTIRVVLFNQPLDHLPTSLTSLTVFSSRFNQPLDYLPPSLTYLKMQCYSFNHPLDHLPHSLLTLDLQSNKFDFAVDHLPYQLRVLRLLVSSEFSQSLPLAHLPPSLVDSRVDTDMLQQGLSWFGLA